MAIPTSISEFLNRHHAHYVVLTHPVAYTAQEEAAAARVPGHEWAKVVVCVADERPLLAVLPAPAKVDFKRLRNVTHMQSLRLAHEAEFKGMYTDCEIGAMPPLGPLYGQDVVVDESLAADDEIVFEAGSHHESIRMPYSEFHRLVRPTVAAFTASHLPPPISASRHRLRRPPRPLRGTICSGDATQPCLRSPCPRPRRLLGAPCA